MSFGNEMMSQHWVCEMEFSTELVEYGGRRWVIGIIGSVDGVNKLVG